MGIHDVASRPRGHRSVPEAVDRSLTDGHRRCDRMSMPHRCDMDRHRFPYSHAPGQLPPAAERHPIDASETRAHDRPCRTAKYTRDPGSMPGPVAERISSVDLSCSTEELRMGPGRTVPVFGAYRHTG
jgi:hypothetical protein